jgi:hypothetical protein
MGRRRVNCVAVETLNRPVEANPASSIDVSVGFVTEVCQVPFRRRKLGEKFRCTRGEVRREHDVIFKHESARGALGQRSLEDRKVTQKATASPDGREAGCLRRSYGVEEFDVASDR